MRKIALVAFVVLLAACGSDDAEITAPTTPPTPAEQAAEDRQPPDFANENARGQGPRYFEYVAATSIGPITYGCTFVYAVNWQGSATNGGPTMDCERIVGPSTTTTIG